MIRIFLALCFFTLSFFPSNGQNNLCLLDLQVWNSSTGQFDTLLRFEYFYDSNNNLRQFKSLLWESINGNYVYTSKAEITYSGNSGPDYILDQLYDFNNGLWVNSSEYFYEYDINGNLTKDSIRDYNTQSLSWYPYYRFREFYYYTGNVYTAHLLQDWVSGSWVNTDSISRVFDTSGLLLEHSTSIWNAGLDVWENDLKISLSYQGSLVIDSVIQTWDGSNYINTYKYQNDYLGNGKVFTRGGYVWDTLFNNWFLSDMDTFFYDLNNNLIENNYYHLSNNLWNPLTKIQYTYGNCLFVGVTEAGNYEKIEVYPNPASSVVTLSFPQTISNGFLRILTLDGQIVYESRILASNSINIDISGLSTGIYIGEILANDKPLRIKFMKTE